VGNAFHHAAITHEYIGVVVDDVMAWAVELCSQGLLGDGETDCVGKTLTQRAGGGFNASGVAHFRVARGF